MVTEVVKTVKASGGDYTSWATWESSRQRNLVSADEREICEIYNNQTVQVYVNGWTTDTTRRVVIRADPTNEWAGDRTTGVHAVGTSNQPTVRTGHDIEIIGMRLAVTGTYGTRANVQIDSNGTVLWLRRLYGYTYNVGRTFISTAYGRQTGDNQVENCLSYGDNFWSYADKWRLGDSGHVANNVHVGGAFFNCTSASGSDTGSTMVVYNNFLDCSGSDFVTGSNTVLTTGTTTDYNATDKDSGSSSLPGSNNVYDVVPGTDFNDPANRDYSLVSGSALIGTGTNLYSTFTDDVFGDTRQSSGAWEIGYDYYVSSGVTGTAGFTAPSATATMSGSPVVVGTSSATAPAATFSASASLTGTMAATAPSATASMNGAPIVSGSAAASASVPTMSAAGSPVVVGQAQAAAPLPGMSGSGSPLIAGAGQFSGPVATVSASGNSTVTGTSTATAPSVSVSINGSPVLSGVAAMTGPAVRFFATNLERLTFNDTSWITRTAARDIIDHTVDAERDMVDMTVIRSYRCRTPSRDMKNA